MYVNVKDFGAVGDGLTNDTLAVQAAINNASINNPVIYFPSGTYNIENTLNVTSRGIRLIGAQKGRSVERASIIAYKGTGECIKIGDSSLPSFGGYQGFSVENMSIVYNGPAQLRGSLNNPFSLNSSNGWYGVGTYGIRDYRGGDIQLRNVQIEHFEYGFWGTQSDINSFERASFFYNKIGIKLEAGSDQFTAKGLYTFGNDTVLDLNGITGARFIACEFVKEGSATDYPILIDNLCNLVSFETCWFEGLGNVNSTTVPAYVKIGANTEVRGVVFRDSTLAIGNKVNGIPICNYFVEVVNGKRILIDEVGGYPNSLKKLVGFSGSSNTKQVTLRGSLDPTYFSDGTYYDNNGTGNASIIVESYTENGKEINNSFTRAYLNGTQNIAAATWTRVGFNTTSTDDLLEFDATNSQFKAKYTGKYKLSTFVITNQQVSGNRTRLGLFVDTPSSTGGAAHSYLDDRTVGGQKFSGLNGSLEIKLNAGQTIDVRIYSENAISLPGGGGADYLIVTRI